MNATRLETLIEALLLKLEQMAAAPQANLKKSEFARRCGFSIWTLNRKIKAGQVRTEKGRIPASELSKFCSSPLSPLAHRA